MSKKTTSPAIPLKPAEFNALEQSLVDAQAAVAAADQVLAAALGARATLSERAVASGMSIYRVAQLYGTDRNVVYNDLKKAQALQ